MKRIASLAVVAIMIFTMFAFCGCGVEKIAIPSLVGSDIESAKDVLTGLGLVPITTEKYSDNYGKGIVDSVSPNIGEKVKKGSSVNIIVSKGYKTITAQSYSGTVKGFRYSSNNLGWSIDNSYISSGVLYIDFHIIINTTSSFICTSFIDKAFASLDSEFKTSVPAQITTNYFLIENTENYYHTLHAEIPLEKLGGNEPTDVYLKVAADQYGDSSNITFSFSYVWNDMSVTKPELPSEVTTEAITETTTVAPVETTTQKQDSDKIVGVSPDGAPREISKSQEGHGYTVEEKNGCTIIWTDEELAEIESRINSGEIEGGL